MPWAALRAASSSRSSSDDCWSLRRAEVEKDCRLGQAIAQYRTFADFRQGFLEAARLGAVRGFYDSR